MKSRDPQLGFYFVKMMEITKHQYLSYYIFVDIFIIHYIKFMFTYVDLRSLHHQ